MSLQVLYFDLGNVLLSFSHERMWAQMAEAAGVNYQTVWQFVFEDQEAGSMLRQVETGQISTDEYFQVFCRATGARPDRPRLTAAVCDIFEPIGPTWELVRRLAAAGHRLAILSNTNLAQWEFVTDGRFPLLADVGRRGGVFGWAVLSYEAHAMKPDREIYDAAISRAGVPAGQIFFVDDRPENVAGAKAAGLDAVQFEGTAKLAESLCARGISAC